MDRYERQARFAGLGQAGQRAIAAGAVTIVGCGAVGSASADLLARAGIGRLRLVDRDVVEMGNLHRQSLFDEEDVRRALPKAEAAAAHLSAVRSDLEVEPIVADLDGLTARSLLAGSDVVLDGTDNFEARHVLNEACLELGLPWVHAACLGATAVAWPLVPGRTACFACLVPDAPAPGEVATCDSAGVIAPAVHAAASAQVVEAMKLLAGRHDELLPGPWTYDAWTHGSARVRAVPDPACRACARREWSYLGRARCADAVLCGRTAVQLSGGKAADLEAVARRLAGTANVSRNEFLVRFSAGPSEDVTVFRDGRVLVSGTRDAARARAIAARFLGG